MQLKKQHRPDYWQQQRDIGLEWVKQLTEQGAHIIVTGRRIDALNETKRKFPN